MPALRTAAFTLLALIAISAEAPAQVQVKVNENVNFKFGVLGQVQGDWLEDPAKPGDYQQNLFIRRIRLLFGGQVAKNVSFFIETDAPNLGKTISGMKNISPQIVVQDAYGEVRFHDGLQVDFGLMFVPFSRNSIQSAATLLPIDYGAYTFTQSTVTQSTVGRDAGVQAKGYFLKNRLEYRIGAFQGARDEFSRRAFRYAGRVQVQLLDPEPQGFFYAGTYLGARKVAAVGGAFDRQEEFLAYDFDGFLDLPAGPVAFTAQTDYHHFDGDVTFRTLPEQEAWLVETGLLIRAIRLTPVFQYNRRNIIGTRVGDENRWFVGANYWWAGHNANIKAAWGRINPRGRGHQNEFTVQFQFFYY